MCDQKIRGAVAKLHTRRPSRSTRRAEYPDKGIATDSSMVCANVSMEV